jgi:hypothetical protein
MQMSVRKVQYNFSSEYTEAAENVLRARQSFDFRYES